MHPKLTQTVNQLSVLRCSVMSESVTPWIVAHQAPLFMGFSRLEYWSGLPWPPLGDLPDPGIKPTFLMSPALAGGFFTTSSAKEAPSLQLILYLVLYASFSPTAILSCFLPQAVRPQGRGLPQVGVEGSSEPGCWSLTLPGQVGTS